MQPETRSSTVERLSCCCNHYAEHTVFVIGLTMTAIVIVQVFSRYVLNHSLFWSEEMARYLLVWLTFLGASVAYHRGMHPSINLFQHRFSRHLKNRLCFIVHLLSLAFFAVMIWYGTEFAYFVRLQTTPALALPKWFVFAVIPFSGSLLALHAVGFLLRDFRSGGNRT